MHEVKWKIKLNTLLHVQCGASKQESFWFESCGRLVASLCGVYMFSLCGICPCTGQRYAFGVEVNWLTEIVLNECQQGTRQTTTLAIVVVCLSILATSDVR